MSQMPPPPPPPPPPLPPGGYGGPGPGAVPGAVPSNLGIAITGTIMAFLFCCLLGIAPGIVAIVQGSQVNGRLNAGDYAGAQRASQNARTWGWVALGLGLAGLVLLVALAATGNLTFYYGGDTN